MTRAASDALLDRYGEALLPVFGRPQLALTRGEGCYVLDADGNRYLDLLAGVAVNSLGHGHPALVSALREQAAEAIHVSNFFTTPQQVDLAERILALAGAPEGSAVFFTNSGTEALEAAIKLARRTGRERIVAAEQGFHGRSTGAVALTWKPAYREPFAPLIPGVSHVRYNDVAALEQLFAEDPEGVSALVLEPIQGEAGVIPADPAYLRRARELTREYGALLILDEVQTGIGRTGTWFGFEDAGILPDAFTLAKGLGGGVPVGALVTVGPEVTGLLTAGQHGSTFGGNPLACAAGLAVLDTIERDGLLDHVRTVGDAFAGRVSALKHPGIVEVRGRGLHLGVVLREPVAAEVAARALDAGFIVNAPAPDVLRIVPPLVISDDELAGFVDALPGLLTGAMDAATAVTTAGAAAATDDVTQPTRSTP